MSHARSHTTSKLAEILGADFERVKQADLKEVKLEQDRIIVYSFAGKMKRAGVGHIAIWDGKRYYSYGSGKKNHFKGLEASDEYSADYYADADAVVYGWCRKIVLLIDEKFLRNREYIQNQIYHEWQPSQYNMLTHNCVHMVQDYLLRANILYAKIPYHLVFTPSDLEDVVRAIGKRLHCELDQRQAKFKPSANEVQNRLNYLFVLQEELPTFGQKKLPNGINDIKTMLADTDLNNVSSLQILKLFDSIKHKLSEKNYDNVFTRAKTTQDFYTKWFIGALNPDSILAAKQFNYTTETLADEHTPILYGIR